MIMPVMDVGIMGMRMAQRHMLMRVHMWLLAVPTILVGMLMMGVVAVCMRV